MTISYAAWNTHSFCKCDYWNKCAYFNFTFPCLELILEEFQVSTVPRYLEPTTVVQMGPSLRCVTWLKHFKVLRICEHVKLAYVLIPGCP